MKFVIVGLGSIGKRHRKNLLSLGHQVIECHRDDSLKKLLEKHKSDGVFICNPTSLHLESAMMAAKGGYNIFLEKPISDKLERVDELLELVKKKRLVLQVGYNLRFQSGLKNIKNQLDKKAIGKVYSARIEVGSYLPDWRPGVDYKKNYSSRKDLGGGVLLDLSHEIDYAVWFFGQAKIVSAIVKYVPELGIETEALAELIVEFKSGVVASIHLDYLQKEYRRGCQIFGERGQFVWNYVHGTEEARNETFMAEINNFINSIKGREKPLVTGKEAKHVLEIIVAAKKSAKLEQTIKL